MLTYQGARGTMRALCARRTFQARACAQIRVRAKKNAPR